MELKSIFINEHVLLLDRWEYSDQTIVVLQEHIINVKRPLLICISRNIQRREVETKNHSYYEFIHKLKVAYLEKQSDSNKYQLLLLILFKTRIFIFPTYSMWDIRFKVLELDYTMFNDLLKTSKFQNLSLSTHF